MRVRPLLSFRAKQLARLEVHVGVVGETRANDNHAQVSHGIDLGDGAEAVRYEYDLQLLYLSC